ncbi:DM13 domain-containing protein [Pseudanabaena galeata UHCC 0370]|jgi:hypothetical protein|uniref:DM13 domain-containing protein n=1 Tax=Pseudanabaena galeata UHCC 0370 TaxID=3110310 RepID=A0ABU5THY8_9CYAN|nr:DM13 domain-containing protein [Pseudanabaena galeata]MEA5477754.1 DM13 domain-containing protein [Pseudanabaena galeata UHCC 0370]
MNYRFMGLIAGLTLTAAIISCSATSTTTEATPASTSATKPADTIKNDAMKGDAMKDGKSANVSAPTTSRSGSFISAEHPTKGKARIAQENGNYFIELDEGFKTSENGPDLFVILHRSPNILNISKPPAYAIAEADYTVIAPLKSFNGKQRYEIPKDIQIDKYQSIAVWCRMFNATFGFAPLS